MLDFPLSPFEQATLEQMVSFRAKDDSDIERLLADDQLKQEAKARVASWDIERMAKGLKPWNV